MFSSTSSLATEPTSLDASATINAPANTPFRILLGTTPSNLIGFAKVSGLYGPGTWSGWFLTLSASWIRLFRKDSIFDINTWPYILGMNWAAGDLLIKIRELKNLRIGDAEDWMRDCATIGAAYNIVFWGLQHAICQTAVCIGVWGLGKTQRLITLLTGVLLPATLLTIALLSFDILDKERPGTVS